MEKDLELYLEILNSERCLKKPKEAIIILDKITKCFSQEKSQFTIGLLTNLLLNGDKSLFDFIWKMSFDYENVSAASAAFKLLDYLVSSFQKCIEPYFSLIFKKCLSLLNAKFAKVKEMSLKLIKNMIFVGSKNTLKLSKLVLALEELLEEETKIPGIVLDQIYSLLGYLFEKFPETVKSGRWFFSKIYESIMQEGKLAKGSSVKIMRGAFEGINGYLTNYTPPDEETMKNMYNFIKFWSKFHEERKAASLSALKILQNHWSHFSNFIYDDKEFWRINLEVWIKQKREYREAAFKFLCAFYSVIALFVKQEPNRSEMINYLKEFTSTLELVSNSCQRKAALVGIKLFVLTGSLTGNDFKRTYDLLVTFIRKHESRPHFSCLPLSLECVSAFVLKFSNESFYMEQLAFLQRLTVKLIDSYSALETESQPNALIALEKSFYMLGLGNSQIMESHIDKVLYQGLIRTCSAMTVDELELLKERKKDSNLTSYKSCIGLWKYLLTLASSPILPVGGSYSLKEGVAVKVFDSFIYSFLKILSSLNFSVDSKMDIEKLSDFRIFINIVDLYQDLILYIDPFNLKKWLIEIFKTAIYLSNSNPLVSGFYRIIETSLRVAELIQYFDDVAGEKGKCFEQVRNLLQDILIKVDQFKGDLQLACLKVILATPVKIIESFIEKSVPALEIVIQFARSSPPLLKDLIDTLERWDFSLPSVTSRVIMKRILPYFDIFFQSPYFQGNSSVDWSKVGRTVKNQVIFKDSEFLELQKRFLIFLGNLEISKAMNLIEVPHTKHRRQISDKKLVYSLPCNNGWVELSLEELISRIVDLAESCGDRKTRITACELLYSMVMIILGNIYYLSGSYKYLFQRVLKTCLILGCDPDGLICQIFEPLMYQIAHYFSGRQALHFPETNDLIEILISYVSCPYNPTVRDFSALLIREFTIWSIKQLNQEELNLTSESVKRILQKIYSLALHPSHNKRIGAAIVFNKIYSILREEESILNAYWFELFYYFMESLRMCDGPEDVTEITEAIEHVKRPLVEMPQEFNKDCPNRVVPPEFKGCRLCHLVRWTMERACDIRPIIRRTAMALVQNLAPLVENCDSDMRVANQQLQNFFHLKENSFNLSFGEEDFITWLKYQNTGFEFCTWLLKENILTTNEVFVPEFRTVLRQFICGILSYVKSSVVTNGLKRESILSFLALLCALKERAYLFPLEHWDLLKMVIFKPSRLGFDLNQTSVMEQLFSVVKDLLSVFSNRLIMTYNWNYFYKNLDGLITVPVFSHITINQYVSLESSEFLFALRVIETSGLGSMLMKKIFFSLNEDLLLMFVFKALFLEKRRKVYAVALEPSCRSYFEDLLKVILNLSCDLKSLMQCLENVQQAHEEETGKVVKKGEFFQTLFQNVIFGFLRNKHYLLIEWALRQKNIIGIRLLLQVLENCSESSALALEIFHRWQDFENLKLNEKYQKNEVLLHLAACSARVIGTPGFLKTSVVANKIYTLLENRKFNEIEFYEIEAIVKILPYLSVFAEGIDENERLRACLSNIQVDVDALKKSKDTLSMSREHFALLGLLHSLKTTGSLLVLNFIMSRANWFNIVCQRENMDSALSIFGDSRIPISHSVSALELAYGYCFECQKTDFLPSVVYKLFLGPLMRVVPKESVCRLVLKNTKSLCDLVTFYWGSGRNSMDILVNMSKKICAAGVFQTFINKFSKEEFDELPKDKRQMMISMVREVFFLLKKPYPPLHLKERYRKLMCEIFNMICCIVSARCSDEKFYKLFVFDDRGSFLFESIDKNLKYNLGMDFDEIPKRKKHLTLLREAIRKENRNTLIEDSIKYIPTNTLFTSSLKEDVTRFDLTLSLIRPMDSASENSIKNLEIELEMDSLNSHECMPTLIATISKMVRDKIGPINDGNKLPCWLKFFLKVLSNPNFCENLKLFILKAIYNVQEFVKPFCEMIFYELIDAILKIFNNYHINYFLLDLIEMMLEWRHVPEKERTRFKLTELVEFVLYKSNSFRRDIIKHNLDIMKAMIEIWKKGLHLPYLSSLAFTRLSKSIEKDLIVSSNLDSMTYFNIHTCGILLTNGIPAWKKGFEKHFFNLILKNFRNENKHKEIFGEVCGLALKYVQNEDPVSLEDCEELVREKIASEANCWFQFLYGVHKRYPKISSLFTFKIFSSAWDSTDSLIVKKLEVLLSHVSGSETAEDSTFDRHAFAFILDMLNSPDVAVHEVSLQIAEKLIDKLDNDKLRVFMMEISRLQRSIYFGVRKWVYEICKKVYPKSSCDYVLKQSKVILLKGLSDSVPELEKSCLEFWRGILNLKSPASTFLQILREMYTSETEDIFLRNTAKILLEIASDDDKSKLNIFSHPLIRNCKFEKRNLVLGPRESFFLSLSSSGRTLKNQSLENLATIRQVNFSYLRPTPNSLKFQPTVEENCKEIEILDSSSLKEDLMPKNPFKQRFSKSGKDYYSFANSQKEEEKLDFEDEEKRKEVDIYGEYTNGNYPDIQIPHSQIMKLLEVLAKKDNQIARIFVVSFYSGLMKTIKTEEKVSFLSETRESFECILKSSANFDPGLFGFVLQVILNHSEHLDIDCQLISNAAVSSNWISLGALIIEQMIANKERDSALVPKKRKLLDNSEDKRWLELAKLYRSLEEFDVLSGIFLDKLKVRGEAREAFLCETDSDWQEASKHFEKVLKTKHETTGREFYTESYLSCLAKLSNWSSLNKCIRTTVNNDLNDLWTNYNLLSWFLKSEMMISLGADQREFQMILQGFCKKNVRENILSANFGEEMTVFDWFSDNFHRASYRIDRLCLDFLADWSHLDQWSHNLRAAKLTNLQTLSELFFVIKNVAGVSKTQLQQNIAVRLKMWEKNLPDPCDDLTVWDVKLGYRREFFKRLKQFEMRATEVKFELALARAALSQSNLNMAKECLSRAKEKLPEGNFELRAEHSLCFNLGKMALAKLRMKDEKIGLKVYLNVWNGLSKQILSTMQTDSVTFSTFVYSCNFSLGQLISDILPYVKNRALSPTELKLLCFKLKSSQKEVVFALELKALEHFETARRALEIETCSVETKSNVYLELCKFFLKFPDSGNFEKLCKYLLKSMGWGNPEARELFGCVLSTFYPSPDKFSVEDIISEGERVPTWMFLMWINQMLASLNSRMSLFLRSILLRVTQDYPNAIRYALKLTEDLKGVDPKTKSFLVRLYGIVSKDSVYDDFWNSMKYLASPQSILRHYLEDALHEADRTQPNFLHIKRIIFYLQELMFSESYIQFRGPIFKFWEKFKEPLLDLLTEIENQEVLKRKIKNLLSSIQHVKMSSKKIFALLQSYSPWLYKFHALKVDTELELPGQYDGNREPIKKYLVTVTSFKNSVLIFDSKTRPVRINILGNDAKEHKFLVKFGEDLRQDERIQQVFLHFNHRLRESKQTRRLFIDTYKVIPLTLSLGMIEWVDDNVSLYEMIENSLGNNSDAIVKAQSAHLSFLSQGSPLAVPDSIKGSIAAHLIAYERIPRDRAIYNFRLRTEDFPKDLLKRAFMDLSISTEHFIHLRKNFATSHAVLCITHWLIGIGDRHLQNILVSTNTSRVLGIDFGYAFGFATQFLTPPELIPFRLTPQILGLMHPLDESGWIKQTMIYCLKVFRKESFRLRSVLEVFAQEPVIDWLKQAKKNPNYKSENPDTWYPKEKLSLVEKKLNGVNPVVVFEADLRAGHSELKYLNKYVEVLKGVEQCNVRASYGEDGLTEEQQVECLIDLATDPHILAKTYIGWNPWL